MSFLKRKIVKFITRKESINYFWKIRNKALTCKGLNGSWQRYKYSKILIKNNAAIPYTCTFENEVSFPHGISGVFISCGAHIGKDCIIFQQVTIGSNTLPNSKSFGTPTIGNNVYIGAGAKIIGGVKIGNHVRIGANCVVTEDIPDNCTVVLDKPRIIKHDTELKNEFIPYDDPSIIK